MQLFSRNFPWSSLRVGIPFLLLAVLFTVISQLPDRTLPERTSEKKSTTAAGSLFSKFAKALPELPSPDEVSQNSQSLTDWLAQGAENAAADPEIIALARERGQMMKALIQADPEAALSAMLPLHAYRDLPAEIAELIESPFATAGSLSVVPNCSSSNRQGPDFFGRWEGTQAQVFVPSGRQEVLSKDWISLSGVQVEGLAALHAESLWKLSEEEVAIAAELFALPLPKKQGPTALLGGEFVVASAAELDELSFAVRELETLPDPTLRPIFSDGGDDEEEIASVLRDLSKASSSWTLTDKKVLFLNLQFSDSTGPGVAKSEIESRLAACGTRTDEMSYGKVSFSQTLVSDALTLPGTEASYENGSDILYSQMHDEALDLAVTAGLISGSATSDWSDEYDIIGIVFPGQSIGWSGRASVGGRRHWINGAASFGTYIHEFGHNFGLNHASRWNETLASEIPPTPPTASNLSNDDDIEPRHSEYGDWFDYMGGDGEFSVLAKNRLSWIDDSKIVDLTGNNMKDQTVRLYRFDETVADSKPTLGARVQMQESETFWLNYRGNHAQSIAKEGVHVLWQFTDTRGRLLDMTPENTTTRNTLLPLGRTFTDPTGLVNITPLSKGGIGGEEWLDVRIVTGIVGNTNPTLALSADMSSAGPLQEVTFTANGSDDDGDPLLYNWDFGDGRTESAGGASFSHRYLVGGNYIVTASALDGRGGFVEQSVAITVTDPLLSLASVESGTTSNIREVVYHAGRFLALTSTQLLSSFDGTIWEELSTPSPVSPHDGIEVSNSGITLVGSEYLEGAWRGQIWHSEDGINWETIDTPVGTDELNSVCEGNNLTVAVGDSGTIMRKLGASAWETASSGTTQNLKKVYHDGTRFWALGNDNTILTSTDTTTWTPTLAETDGYSWSDYETGLAIGGSFYAAGDYGRLGVTTDAGATWSEKLDSIADIFAFAATPQRVICFGNDFNSDAGRTQADVLFASVDGERWAEAALASPFKVNAAVFGAGRLVAVGDGGVIQVSAPFVTGNQPPSGSLNLPAAVAARSDFSPTGMITDVEGDPLNYYWNLGDGWTARDPIATFRYALGGSQTLELAVVDSQGGVLRQSFAIEVEDPLTSFDAITTAGGTDYTDVICVDGAMLAISWGELHTAASGEALTQTSSINPFYPADLASDGSAVTLVGQTYDFSTQTWVGGISSAPAMAPVPLTAQTIPSDSRLLNGVVYGNNTWVAVGDGGRLLSKNGANNWEERTSGVTSKLREIAFGDNLLMAVGDSGTVLVSPDGTSWTSKPGPTTSNISHVDFCGDGFCFGAGNAIHFSSDGGDTWSSKGYQNLNYKTAVWTGDLIVVLADLYDFGLGRWVAHLFISTDGVTWENTPADALDGVTDLVKCQETLVAVGSGGLLLSTNLALPEPASPLRVSIMGVNPASGIVLSIPSQPGESFDIYRSADLTEILTGTPFVSEWPAHAVDGITEWTDSDPLPERAFYRVERSAP